MKKLLLLVFAGFALGCSSDETIKYEIPTVTEISFESKNFTIALGETIKLPIKHLPSDLTAPEYIYKSADENIVAIENGSVKGVAIGETEITVEAKGLNLASKCVVKVMPIDVESITIIPTSISLKLGEKQKVEARIAPYNATAKNIEWISSDEKIATVNNGNIEAVGIGECLITAKHENGKEGTCNVSVLPIKAESIVFDDNFIYLMAGDTQPLAYSIFPENTANKEVIIDNNAPFVATYENGIVTAIREGDAVITVASKDGGAESHCVIRVVGIKHFIKHSMSVNNLSNAEGKYKGDVALTIKNNSKHPITNVRAGISEIYDETLNIMFDTPLIQANGTASFNATLDHYRPVFVIKFEFEGKEYTVGERILWQ